MSDEVRALAKEPRGRIFLTNLLEGMKLGLVEPHIIKRVIELIKEKAHEPRPSEHLSCILDDVLRQMVSETDPTPIHHMAANHDRFEIDYPQIFATNQNLKFLRGVIDGAEGEHLHIIESLADLFEGELDETQRVLIEAKIQEITRDHSENGFFNAAITSSLAGPHIPHLGPFWVTFANHERFLKCSECPSFDQLSARADFVRDRLGLIHITENDFMACYVFEYEGTPPLMISRSTALHGTGWRFRQRTGEDTRSEVSVVGKTLNLKAFADGDVDDEGAPELVMDRFVPFEPISVRIGPLGRPMQNPTRVYDTTPEGDEKYASYLASGITSDDLVDKLLAAA